MAKKTQNIIIKEPPSDKEIEVYKRDLGFEHELINRRLTWLLTSQTIFFAALALSVRDKALVDYIPWIGIIISVLIFIGIFAGVLAKFCLHRKINDGVVEKNNRQPLGVATWITIIALIPDLLLPISFVVAWSIILRSI